MKWALTLLMGGVFLLSAVYAFRGDILYDADIARDFLLLDEIAIKKIVLIGPRSGAAPGFFHGPAWPYLNLPAFLIGNGNPVAVGLFWVFLNGLFLTSCYYVAKKLFNTATAYLFTLLCAVRMIGFSRGMFNPHGALLIIPLYLYLLIKYLENNKYRYLLFHLTIGGLLVQFQIAIGAPFLITSLFIVTVKLLREKKNLWHLSASLVLFVVFASYLFFDFRHNFLMSQAVLNYLKGNPNHLDLSGFVQLVLDRISLMFGAGLYIFAGSLEKLNYVVSLFILFCLAILKLKKNRLEYPIFIYYYLAFFVFSLAQKAGLGVYYYLPLFTLPLLILFSLQKVISKTIFYTVVVTIFAINIIFEIQSLNTDLSRIGTVPMSWQFNNNIARNTFDLANKQDFGIFIYSQDVLAYRLKYPLIYQQKQNQDTKMSIFEKKPLTFFLIAGPPEYSLPWPHDPDGFKKNSIKISSLPVETVKYNYGYSIEKYLLSIKEINEQGDPYINNWLHFR